MASKPSNPLIMKESVQFKVGGAEASVEFDYEHFDKHCLVCFALTHEGKKITLKPQRTKALPFQVWE